MKNLMIFFLLAVFFSCKTNTRELEQKQTESPVIETAVQPTYPKDVLEVFNAHGGLGSWKSFKALSYTIPKTESPETHTIALHSRKDKFTMPAVELGSDGLQVWFLDENNSYKGDAVFCHNLIFYFFAMPFFLADEGILYEKNRIFGV